MSAFWRISNEQFSSDPICGISACKVYPQMMLPPKAVGSYPTFSSFHPPFFPDSYRDGEGKGLRLFSVALSVLPWFVSTRTTATPALHRCIALCCPDFPPPLIKKEAITRPVAKGKDNFLKVFVSNCKVKSVLNCLPVKFFQYKTPL